MGAYTSNASNEKLNIYLFGDSEDFRKSTLIEANNNSNNIERSQKSPGKENAEYRNFENSDSCDWVCDFSGKSITKENFDLLMSCVKNKIQSNQEYNCILIFLDEIYKNEKICIIYDYLANIKKVYKPIVILAFNKEKNEKDLSNTNNYFEIAFYTKKDYSKIYKKIKSVYSYYFNKGDYGFMNLIQILNDFTSQNEKNENKQKYKATFNILVMGKTGCGKSTLINLLLNEKRAREGIGYSITKFYSQYIHEKYPITFTDTVGFEDQKSLEKMKNFLNICQEFFNEGKSKFHLILYLINAGSERTFIREELNLVDYIRNKLNLPIFFVCTHSRTEELSLEFKEAVKISLIHYLESKAEIEKDIFINQIPEQRTESANQNQKEQTKSTIQNQTGENVSYSTNENSEDKAKPTKKIKEKPIKLNNRFQEQKTKLINSIYCCHLINEKDGKYKRFGIDEILRGIKNHFSDEIKEIKKIGKDFTQETYKNESINIKGSTDQKAENKEIKTFNIMRSLENSNSFSEYLKNLSVNICKNYENKISKIKSENEFNLDSKISKLIETLKNHLAFEFNYEPSSFHTNESDEKGNIFWSIFTNIFSSIEKKIQTEKENINKFIDNKLKNDIKKINSDMIGVIESYEIAVKSFEEIIEDINKKN